MNTITSKQRAHYIHEIIKVIKSTKGMSIEDEAELIFENVVSVAINQERDIWERLLFVRDDDKAH